MDVDEESDDEEMDENDLDNREGCSVCGDKESADEKEEWFGCDKCELWYHGKCIYN